MQREGGLFQVSAWPEWIFNTHKECFTCVNPFAVHISMCYFFPLWHVIWFVVENLMKIYWGKYLSYFMKMRCQIYLPRQMWAIIWFQRYEVSWLFTAFWWVVHMLMAKVDLCILSGDRICTKWKRKRSHDWRNFWCRSWTEITAISKSLAPAT